MLPAAERREAAKRLLIDAVALFRRASTVWQDVEGAIEVVYAVDVDVIKMYANPELNTHYGAVFAGAPDVDLLVTSLLGEYIVHRRGVRIDEAAGKAQQQPLLLLQPHGAELRGQVLKLSGEKSRQLIASRRDTKMRGQLKAELALLDRTASNEALISFLTERASDLTKILLGKSGADAALAQLHRITRGLLTGPDEHPAFQGPEGLHAPPGRDDTGDVADGVARHADDWFERMQADDPRGARVREINFDKDAWALASLEWINDDAAQRNLKKRVVLISGTPRLFDIADAQPCLRDPRAFMGLKDFFEPRSLQDAPPASFGLRDWFDLCFPHSVRENFTDPVGRPYAASGSNTDFGDLEALIAGNNLDAALDILLGGKEQDGLPFPDFALKQWRDVVTDTHVQRVLGRTDGETLGELRYLLSADAESIDDRIDEVLMSLSERAAKAFAGLYLATGVIGVEQLLDEKRRIRGLPALRFDSRHYPEAQRQCDALSDELFKKEGRQKTFDLRKMYDRLTGVEGSHYHAHVLHAYVYASTGRWVSARTLCRVALVVANAQPIEQPKQGREAAYFLAVAERRIAKDAAGLEQAAEALALARQRDASGLPEDIRFTSEALAQAMAKWQLVYFRGAPCDPQELFAHMREACALSERAVRPCDPEPRGVRAWVVRQAVTNGLVAALLAADAGRWTPQVTGMARSLIGILESEHLAPLFAETPGTTYYFDGMSDFVWLVAVAKFDATRAAAAKAQLASFTMPERSQVIVHFERERFSRFMRLVGAPA